MLRKALGINVSAGSRVTSASEFLHIMMNPYPTGMCLSY